MDDRQERDTGALRRRELLDAARRIVREHGVASLSLASVAQEAGVTKALIPYYWGSKEAFVAALIDSVLDQLGAEKGAGPSEEEASLGPLSPGTLEAVVTAGRQIVLDRDGWLLFYAVLPEALRRDDLRERLAAVYEWQRRRIGEWLCGYEGYTDDAQVQRVAVVLHAVIDGIGAQYAVDPTFDAEAALTSLMCLPALLRDRLPAPPSSSEQPPAGPRGEGNTPA
jgi:AcrR family transcriptional regulator